MWCMQVLEILLALNVGPVQTYVKFESLVWLGSFLL